MSSVQIHDKIFVPFISEDSIQKGVAELANQINQDYKGKKVVFVAILNGAFMFSADLLKHIELDCEITFVKVSSYKGTGSMGRVDELIGLTTNLLDRHVVILEDIVDTGITMDKIHKIIELELPESLKICTLLYKKDAHQGRVTPDYVAFEIENKFVVGYGLDYDESGRNLREILQIKD
jgi:hypoxanthine phosphoribosyltransferase